MDISFCIVSLNAKHHLNYCLRSIPNAVETLSYEILIADNNSKDGSKEYILSKYSNLNWISNQRNKGYTKALNDLIKISQGRYKVILNPDSQLMSNSVSCLIDYLNQNKNIGIVGPKVLNADGSFQKSCRRGLAPPSAVFSYFFGLSRIFNNNKRYTGYHLNHLDENQIHEVSGVSGSCMIIRNAVISDIGYFDEQFFAYQEDSDICLRAIEMGWKIYYNPRAVVVHQGGMGGANSVPLKANFEWHRSYIRYYNKHFSNDYSIIFNWFYYFIMYTKLIISQIISLLKR